MLYESEIEVAGGYPMPDHLINWDLPETDNQLLAHLYILNKSLSGKFKFENSGLEKMDEKTKRTVLSHIQYYLGLIQKEINHE